MPGTLLCTLFTCMNVIHITVPLAGCYHYPHWMDEETAQVGQGHTLLNDRSETQPHTICLEEP